MENNKFNKHYSKLSTSNLIDQLSSYINKGNILNDEWYEALKKHLSERDITEEERKIIDSILSSEYQTFKEDEKQIEIEKTLSNSEINTSDIIPNLSSIQAAGKSLKNIVYYIILLTLITIVGVAIALISKDAKIINYTYIFIGIVSLIINLNILGSLYSAGDHLENS